MNPQSLDQELEKLLERFKANPEGRLFAPLADCYRKLGRLGEALRVCESGLGRHPDYSSALVILGRIHFDRGDLDAADGAFRRVMEMDPHNLVALRQLARAAEARGDLEACREAWNRVATLEPRADDAKEHLERLESEALAPPKEAPPGPPDADPEADPEAKAEHEPQADAAPEPGTETDAAEVALGSAAEMGVDDVEDGVEDAPVSDAEVGVEEVEAAVAATSRLEDDPPAKSERDSVGDVAGTETPKVPGSERANQIATMTLADIYYEQGFKAKALEIYRTVLRDSPQTPGIARKVEQIEAELLQIQDRLGPATELPPQPSLEDLESSDYGDGVLSAGIADEVAGETEEGLMGPRPAPAERKGPPDPLDDDGDFDHFRTWLGRIKARPL